MKLKHINILNRQSILLQNFLSGISRAKKKLFVGVLGDKNVGVQVSHGGQSIFLGLGERERGGREGKRRRLGKWVGGGVGRGKERKKRNIKNLLLRHNKASRSTISQKGSIGSSDGSIRLDESRSQFTKFLHGGVSLDTIVILEGRGKRKKGGEGRKEEREERIV